MEYCQRGIGKTGRPKAPEYLMQNNVFYILQEIILTIWLHKQTRKMITPLVKPTQMGEISISLLDQEL